MNVKNNWMKRIWSILLMIAMVCSWMSLPAAAGATSAVSVSGSNTHYIAVASDRHNTTDAVKIAMGRMPDSVEYVCLNGDMVDMDRGSSSSMTPAGVDTGSSTGTSSSRKSGSQQAYNTSTVLNEVQEVFPHLNSSNVSILYGSHDANATDDAGIMKGADTSLLPAEGGADSQAISQGQSGLIYTGYDGSDPAYYIYGVSFYDMQNADSAQAAAAEFKSWADAHPGLPLIVISHVPIHAIRHDNLGASWWNAALNYAATGSENGTTVTRNVAFLHGHNHTVEKTEYFLNPGDSMQVQGLTSADAETSTIYYNYITAGYLRDNHTATLVGICDNKLTFKKYKGYIVQFNTNGGNDIDRQILTKGDTVAKPSDPTRTGYTFTGWYEEPACENSWNFNSQTISEDTTLYAGWVKGSRPESPTIRSIVKSSGKKTILSWPGVAFADDYRIAYRKADSGKWTMLWANGRTKYTVSGLKKNGLYEFKVRAAAESGDRMIYSKYSNIARRYIGTVSAVKVKPAAGAVKVSWKKDKNACGYMIEYSTSPSMKKAKTVTVGKKKNVYKVKNLKAKKKYYVRVRPFVRYHGLIYKGGYCRQRMTKTK